VFGASSTKITGKFPAPFFRGPQSADDASANVPNDSQVTFPFWPIARRYRFLTYAFAKESLVSFLHPSFADSPLTMLPGMFRMSRRLHFRSGQLQVADEVR